jgi:hypothetical protein
VQVEHGKVWVHSTGNNANEAWEDNAINPAICHETYDEATDDFVWSPFADYDSTLATRRMG